MYIICIKDCFNFNNQPYIKHGVYKFDESDFVESDANSVRYYHIYKVYNHTLLDGRVIKKDVKFGCSRKEFIDYYFIKFRDWYRIIAEVDKEFDRLLNINYV